MVINCEFNMNLSVILPFIFFAASIKNILDKTPPKSPVETILNDANSIEEFGKTFFID